MTRILGIETSCDETAAAVVEDGRRMLSNVVASQAALHAQYGGVFPEVASRRHIEMIQPVISRALVEAHVGLADLDASAVTRGPVRAGSLAVGVNAAKGLAVGRGLPLLGVNHLEGHLYSLWLTDDREVVFPVVCLIVSGGHTELLLMTGHGQYRRLGNTLDDAAGEAFDKVARMLGLDYPGGPALERAAQAGDPSAYKFPRAWLGLIPHREGRPPAEVRLPAPGQRPWASSFSGFATAALRHIKEQFPGLQAGVDPVPGGLPVPNLAASFQAAVVDVLAEKAAQAAREFQATEVFVAGGVSANRALRAEVTRRAPCPVRTPPLALCTDNAAMIAAAAHFRLTGDGAGRPRQDALDFDVLPTWPLV